MDIKEIGICGVFVVGGTAFGFSQLGLNDALSEDLKHYQDISNAERSDYMTSVVSEFSDAFQTYGVQTETYVYMGTSTFTADPAQGLFVEVVKQDEAVPKSELPKILVQLEENDFCAQDEMTMFTNQGWNYSFTLIHNSSQKVATIICSPYGNQKHV